MSKKRRRKSKSQRRSQKKRLPGNYWWNVEDRIGKKEANRGKPLHIVARNENMQPGEFLVRLDGGGIRHVPLRDSQDWRGFERRHPALLSFSGGSTGDLRQFKQSYDSVQAVDHNGTYVKLAHVRVMLHKEEPKISLDDIFRAWGVNPHWQDIRYRLDVDSKSIDRINVARPPRQAEFELLWQEWIDKGISDRMETLYHGTNAGNVANILAHGFRMPGYHGQAFGGGIYMGPVSKAKGYAGNYQMNWWSRAPEGNPKGLRFLIESDVLVGSLYEPSNILYNKTRGEMEKAACQSVYYGGFVNPEWVVYNPAQILIRRVIRLAG